MLDKNSIPVAVKNIADRLEKTGFEAYLVGGCVRDLLLEREPKDWDIATNAKPEEIQKIFSVSAEVSADGSDDIYETAYENEFGTVAVKTDIGIVEVTTYRKEGKYTDKRHPDEIKFAQTIEEDLARRDFTINAMALKMAKRLAIGDLPVDPFGGQEDLKNRFIRAVRQPEERFNEDALRLMRAVRLAAELDFKIENATAQAIKKNAGLLEMIAKERIRDELVKMIMTGEAGRGMRMLEEAGLLQYIIPELREGIGVGQNKHHIYEVFDHNVRALEYAAKNNYSLEVRLAALLHDVGKPRTKAGEGPDCTFYNHEVVGAQMTARILDRLHFPKKTVEHVTHLVRCHLFYYNVGEVTEAGVRRFLRRVGPENVEDLIKVREADRIGSGVPKAVPYKLRHLLFMIEKVKQDPIDSRMIKIDGHEVMRLAGLEPGPKIGQILSVLLEEILDDPKKNTEEYLRERTQQLNQLSESELKKLAGRARDKKEEFETGIEEEIKKKYYVK